MLTNNHSVLVIGGAGYIGSHVVIELCEHGYDVTVFDNLSTGHRVNIDSRVELIEGDILNQNDLSEIFKKNYIAVFHFAALKDSGESMLDPQQYAVTNITGTINVLNQLVKNKIQYFIFSSTAAVYGKPEYLPIDEHHPLKPINFYGFTKLEIERIMQWYGDLKGIRFGLLRYFNAAGYDTLGRIQGLEQNPGNLLPIIMEMVSGKREFINIYGNDYNTPDGTGIRDYIHVKDLAVAHVKTLSAIVKKKENIILNLATGIGFSVLEVIKNTEEVTGKKANYNIVERRLGDSAELVATSKLANDILGWDCKYSDIKNIIKSMWEVYSNDNINHAK